MPLQSTVFQQLGKDFQIFRILSTLGEKKLEVWIELEKKCLECVGIYCMNVNSKKWKYFPHGQLSAERGVRNTAWPRTISCIWKNFLTVGGRIILWNGLSVHDTNVQGHTVRRYHGAGGLFRCSRSKKAYQWEGNGGGRPVKANRVHGNVCHCF